MLRSGGKIIFTLRRPWGVQSMPAWQVSQYVDDAQEEAQ